jgi:heptaprenyl diphosphate synthase
MRKDISRKITITAVLSALSTLAFMLESLFPPLIIPGARMGLSNVFILFTVIVVGYRYGFIVMIVKIILGSTFSGNLSAILYSLPAGLMSCAIQVCLVHFTKNVSLLAISVFGAVVNSVIQNVVFCLVTKTWEYLSYVPYLSLVAIISGLIVGFATYLLIKKIPLKFIAETNN